MPSTRIETRVGWLDGRHEELIAAVQAALVAGIGIPEDDLSIRILEYPVSCFATRPGSGPRYSVVEISMFSGRSIEAKRRLYANLAKSFWAFGVPDCDLKIIIHDVPRENWSVGGVALSDVKIGFRIDV